MKAQTALFADERLTLERSLELTAESLRAYGERYRHWAVAFSGGKDSTAALTVVWHLIQSGRVPRPATLHVLYADTRMELPPLQISALRTLGVLRAQGVQTQVVFPVIDDRFFVYMFGRGVPPPSNTFRWCTPQLKVEPMQQALTALRDATGEKVLMLTGVRVGESAARDQRIALSCGRNGAECGQGWFQETTPESIADTLAPLLHWRVCHVWDWLFCHAPEMGFETAPVASVYGFSEEGTEAERNARTGCVGCNLASRDYTLERVIQSPKWSCLEPLLRLRPLYAELKKSHKRLRKQDERRADGSLVKNPGRLGPLTMEARRWGLEQVLAIQESVRQLGDDRMNGWSLINAEEQDRIQALIAANTWPHRWTGEEDRGDLIREVQFVKGGGRQFVFTGAMFGEER